MRHGHPAVSCVSRRSPPSAVLGSLDDGLDDDVHVCYRLDDGVRDHLLCPSFESSDSLSCIMLGRIAMCVCRPCPSSNLQIVAWKFVSGGSLSWQFLLFLHGPSFCFA